MLITAQNNNLFEGFKIGTEGPTITNIPYTDETIFFLVPEDHAINNLRRLLCLFQLALGLKINFSNKDSFVFSRLYHPPSPNYLPCDSSAL